LTTSRGHPFHMHIYRVQVVSGCVEHEIGEWYDTISSMGECVVRFPAVNFGGRVVFHCHVLPHEDNGAMAWLNVLNSPPADEERVCRENYDGSTLPFVSNSAGGRRSIEVAPLVSALVGAMVVGVRP